MPPSRTAPITAATNRRGRYTKTKSQFRRIWAMNILPLLHPVRDLLLAPLSLVTVEFVRGTGWYPSKYASLLVVLVMGFGLTQLGLDSRFYINQNGLHVFVQSPYEVAGFDSYLTHQDIWDFERLAGRHILWESPIAIRDAIQANPFVSDTRVTLLLPATVIVTVKEVAPALFWVTDEGRYAVNHDGQARRVHELDSQTPIQYLTLYDWNTRAALNRPSLHSVISRQLDPDLVHAMLEIQERYRRQSFWYKPPHHFNFTADHGLQFELPESGTRIYWGDGLHTERKLANLAGIEAYLSEQELQAELIDLRPISRPYFR